MTSQLPLDFNTYDLIAAQRNAERLTHSLYGSKLTPVKNCLARLYEAEVTALPRLLACTFAPEGLKQAAIRENPQDIAHRQRDLASAIAYELDRYGCILLASNPYFQPQMYSSATAQRVAA